MSMSNSLCKRKIISSLLHWYLKDGRFRDLYLSTYGIAVGDEMILVDVSEHFLLSGLSPQTRLPYSMIVLYINLAGCL